MQAALTSITIVKEKVVIICGESRLLSGTHRRHKLCKLYHTFLRLAKHDIKHIFVNIRGLCRLLCDRDRIHKLYKLYQVVL